MFIKTEGLIFDANEVKAIREGENGIHVHFKDGLKIIVKCDVENESEELLRCIWNQLNVAQQSKNSIKPLFDKTTFDKDKSEGYLKINDEIKLKIDEKIIAKTLGVTTGGDIRKCL